MAKNKTKSFLITYVIVVLVAVIAISGVILYDVNNKDELDSSESSSIFETSDNSSSPSGTTSSVPNSTTSSESTQSNSSQESSSKVNSSTTASSVTSSVGTSSITQVTSKDLPTPDDNPFGVDDTECERVCYLTFDDGPGAYTESILQTLADNNVKATFFVVGTMGINKIKNIYNAGHAIGLHTNTHELNQLYASPEAFIKDLTAVSDVVYNKTGIRSNLTRFPGGSTTAYSKLGKSGFETVKEILKEKGYTYFDWNIDSGDTHSKSPSQSYVINEIEDHLKYKGELRDEVCLLFHDIKKVTSEALDKVIKDLKEQGYTFKTLDSTCNNFAFK